MATIIPLTPGDPNQRFGITLDDEPYVLRVRWNTRDDAWYLDAWERDGTTRIAVSIKLVMGIRLGITYNHPLFLAGLFLVPLTDDGSDPGLADLGRRVLLVHLTVADALLSEVIHP